LLLARARRLLSAAATAVYALSVCAKFGVSALYYRGNWAPAGARRLQRLDHAMIFLLIGGIATPAFLLPPGAPSGWPA
jgi:hemolysin III